MSKILRRCCKETLFSNKKQIGKGLQKESHGGIEAYLDAIQTGMKRNKARF